MTPHGMHRGAAWLEMVTWTLIITGMVFKYVLNNEALMPATGGIHGFGFLCFVVITLLIWVNNRWPAWVGILGLVVSAIPFAALPFAVWCAKRGYVDGPWRFAGTEEKPHGPADWVLAQAVRHPVRTGLIALVVIIAVFGTLLYLGPPVDVEGIIRG